MNTISLIIPLLYILLVLGLCTYLLVRGITHTFVGLFAGGALLELIPRLGFLALHEAAGGFAANVRYLSLLTIFGLLGTVCSPVSSLLRCSCSQLQRRMSDRDQ